MEQEKGREDTNVTGVEGGRGTFPPVFLLH